MDKIAICDLEAHVHVGVTAAERAQAQRLLISLEMESDLSHAAASDNLGDTIDYFAVTQRVLELSQSREWNLIEALAGGIAETILREFLPLRVSVEVKKFIIPQTRFVSVSLTRGRAAQIDPP